METLPDIYPLTGLQIGDVQSYVSRAFLYFAPLSKKVLILVDNQPWVTSSQSRSARLWQFMVTKYRMSPFSNSRTRRDDSSNKVTGGGGGEKDRWLAVSELMTSRLSLHGFLVFEVAWRDVHGINYLNELLTDASLALEARRVTKWEFHSAEQAAGCAHLWFVGRAGEARALRGYLAALHSSGEEPPTEEHRRAVLQRTWSSLTSVSEDDYDDEPPTPRPGLCSSPTRLADRPTQYADALLLFRFRDSLLPFKLRQVITSDIRLLTLLESGLPAWVIFLQSYPVVRHAYRPWMRPLARSAYLLASLATVLVGFYDLYKNVPLLRSAAASLCGPLFEWVESCDVVTRIRYLGTILFLRNLRRLLQSVLALLRAAGAVLRALLSPLAGALGPVVDVCGEALSFLAAGLGPAWEVLADVAEAAWAPIDLVLDRAAVCLWPLMRVAMLPVRCAAKVAGCAGSVMSVTYDFGKDIWETVSSSIFEFNHMSEAQQSASAFDMSLLKNLWNDLFSQIFRAIRGILNGILVFFAACNRHRLSIYNHVQTRLRHMLRAAGLARPSCRCKTAKRRSGQGKEDAAAAVECDVCK